MKASIDFFLESCKGIPDEMWTYISNLITLSLSTCTKILPFAFAGRLIYDEFQNRRKGVIDLRVHASTIFTTILIVVFFSNYHWCLSGLDSLIQDFCFYAPPPPKEEEVGKWAAFIQSVKENLDILFKPSDWLYWMLCKVHVYAIFAMQYCRAILLLVSSIFGPLATLTYFLNRSGFSNWSRTYLNVSCWAITLNVFEGIAHAHKAASISRGFGDITSMIISLVIAFLIFMTPTITSQFIGNALLPNLSPMANFATKSISNVGRNTGRIAGGLALKAIRHVPGVNPAIAKAASILKKLK